MFERPGNVGKCLKGLGKPGKVLNDSELPGMVFGKSQENKKGFRCLHSS